jgi:hypothetical protein
MHSHAVIQEAGWKQLIEGLPSTLDEISAAIRSVLAATGYLHLTSPMSMEHYEQIAGQLGTIVLRSDVKVDLDRARNQEQVRHLRGRGGIYSPSPLHLHTDPNADLVSWYCVEQDETGGPMLMLDTGNLEEHFSQRELEILGRVDLWSPSRKSEAEPETLTPMPMLSRKDGRYKLFYAPWLLRDSYDSEAASALEKFAAYVGGLEEKGLISLPIKKHDTIFIDNGRMLHGRGALPETSRRHLVRLYLRAA